ncbi:Cd(II)/Pb(II)-responsive transcriptional regulator [Alteromonas gilva]|uniref:Cd(II)/Pb(II)-responsive transcriptional regulator n=1 Tax=Alteromonas gilva TaxID=2987522 RepID=A0ABT5L147_9ALTE|nr:Cd(II)/Pb(II)-responsive transcriptional regulator [Alteromonas gilva]MDC8830765.1 Cd(II)/Pb(II)-responsive transcriptional regulator [Alteromonas gilva]
MKISQLAAASNVPAKTIRYYEEVGLIAPARRNESGYRHYEQKDIETLIFIRRCRELNMAIDDIKQLLDAQQNPKASCAVVDEMIDRQLKRIRQTQNELAMLEKSLSLLATSCVNHNIENCAILHQLKSA